MDNETPKTPDQNFFDELNQREDQNRQQKNNDVEVAAINKAGIKNVEATNRNTDSTKQTLQNGSARVAVTNPDLAKSKDVAATTDAINKMNLTAFMTNDGLPKLAQGLLDFTDQIKTLSNQYKDQGFTQLSKQLGAAVDALNKVSGKLADTKIKVDVPLQKTIDGLQKSIDAIDFKPTVNVTAPDTKVITTPIDLKGVIAALDSVEKAVNANKPNNKSIDLSSVTSGLSAVQDAIQALRFPVPNYVLPFKDSTGKATQVQLNSSGQIPTSGSGSGGGGLVQIQDSSGNNLNSTSNALDVYISGGSSSGTQYTQGGATVANPTGTAEIWFDASGNPKGVTPSQPLPSNVTDGTNEANVVAGDTGYNGLATTSGTKTYTFTTSSSGAQTLLANTPCEGFSWITVLYTVNSAVGLALAGQFSATSAGTYIGTNSFTHTNSILPTGLGSATSVIYSSPIYGNYFQIAISALTSGTLTGYIILSNSPKVYAAINAIESGTWNVGSSSATGSAVPANAFYLGSSLGGTLTGFVSTGGSTDTLSTTNIVEVASMGYVNSGSTWDRAKEATAASGTTGTGIAAAGAMGIYNSTAPTAVSGDYYQLQLDAFTNLKNTLATALNASIDSVSAGTISAVVNVGQTTVNTTAVQISSTSTIPTNGIIIQALSTNSASIFVGGSGVTTSNGFEIQKGQAVSFTCNLNTLYIISAASTTDKICYNVE